MRIYDATVINYAGRYIRRDNAVRKVTKSVDVRNDKKRDGNQKTIDRRA